MDETERLLTCGQVMEMTCLSRSTLYRIIKRGDFPRPVKIGDRSVRWRLSDVQAWIAARAAER